VDLIGSHTFLGPPAAGAGVSPTAGAEGTGAQGRLDEGTVHEVLSNDRRRLVLEALREAGGAAELGDLAEAVAARETGTDPPPSDARQSVYVSLQQTHLPKLDALDLVEYDGDDREVRPLDRIEEIEVYMEVVPRRGLSWGEFYFGWGLLGLVTTAAVAVGVPVLSRFGGVMVAAAVSAGLAAVAAYHVYRQQDGLPFARLFDQR